MVIKCYNHIRPGLGLGEKMAETMWDHLLALTILFLIALMVYSKKTGKGLKDIIIEVKEAIQNKKDEQVNNVIGGIGGLK